MEARTDRRLPFSVEEFSRRLRLVRETAAARRLDALVINSPENLYYLTGYHSLGYFAHQVLIIPSDAEPCLVVRYIEQSNVWHRSWVQNVEIWRDTEDPLSVSERVLAKSKPKHVGIEMRSWFLTPAEYHQLTALMPGVRFEDCSGLVETYRATKSPEELAYVRAAAGVSSAAVIAGIEAFATARTDLDVAAAVHHAMILAGGEYPPLPPLISVGTETMLGHNTWSGQPIQRGDIVRMEVPGVVGRYLAPLSRTASRGEPPPSVIERYQVALESLESGHAAMKPGATCAEVYAAFASPYLKAGYEVPSKPGYPVGINFPPRWVEEGPYILPNNHAALRPGMVFHTPRTVRVYGEQSPLISETVVITETGCEALAKAPARELFRR